MTLLTPAALIQRLDYNYAEFIIHRLSSYTIAEAPALGLLCLAACRGLDPPVGLGFCPSQKSLPLEFTAWGSGESRREKKRWFPCLFSNSFRYPNFCTFQVSAAGKSFSPGNILHAFSAAPYRYSGW